MILEEKTLLTLLSLSLGGSWGSEGEVFADGEGGLGLSLGATSSDLGFSWVGALAFAFSSSGFSFFAATLLLVGGSDGATWVWSPDFDMIAILVPGSTVSPTLAKS